MVNGPHRVGARVLMMVETHWVAEMLYWTNPRQWWALWKIIFLFKIVLVHEISRWVQWKVSQNIKQDVWMSLYNFCQNWVIRDLCQHFSIDWHRLCVVKWKGAYKWHFVRKLSQSILKNLLSSDIDGLNVNMKSLMINVHRANIQTHTQHAEYGLEVLNLQPVFISVFFGIWTTYKRALCVGKEMP